MLNNFLTNINSIMTSLDSFIAGFIIFIIAGSIHEFAHAYTAYLQGDNTAKNAGRLTLNPIEHISIFGTIIFPLFGALSGFPVIGWMKPVPVNPYNLKSGSRGHALVAFAGPFSNLIQASLGLALVKIFYISSGFLPQTVTTILITYTEMFIRTNILLMAFNMLPIPPLDGNWILFHFSPEGVKRLLERVSRLGILLVYLFVIIGILRPYLNWVHKFSFSVQYLLIALPLPFSFIPLLLCALFTYLLFRESIKHYIQTKKHRVDIKASFDKQARKDIANKKAHSSMLKEYSSIIEKLKSSELLSEKERALLKELTELKIDTDSSICDEVDFNHDDNYCRSCDSFKKCISRMVKGMV